MAIALLREQRGDRLLVAHPAHGLRQELCDAQLADALAAKERDYGEIPASAAGLSDIETKVLWFDDEATGAVVLELRTTDRIGLLHRVAAAVESNSVTIRWARVVTMGGSAVDAFCLTAPGGHTTLLPEARKRIERAVLSAAR